MNPTAGSFEINPRLQRLFMTLAMDFPGQVRFAFFSASLLICVSAFVGAHSACSNLWSLSHTLTSCINTYRTL